MQKINLVTLLSISLMISLQTYASAPSPFSSLKIQCDDSPLVIKKLSYMMYSPINGMREFLQDLIGKIALAPRVFKDSTLHYDYPKADELCTFENDQLHEIPSLVIIKNKNDLSYRYGYVHGFIPNKNPNKVLYCTYVGIDTHKREPISVNYLPWQIGKFRKKHLPSNSNS